MNIGGIILLLGDRLQHCYKKTPLPLCGLCIERQSRRYDRTPKRQNHEDNQFQKARETNRTEEI